MLTGFYAYPSRPTSVGDSVAEAIDRINNAGEIKIIPWTLMSVTGKLIISQICEQIDKADMFFADITDLNANVLFELGYAIGKNKRIWMTMDTSFTESNSKLTKFRALTTIGYASYQNSLEIEKQFYADRPHEDLGRTIFNENILPNLATPDANDHKILYLKSKYDNEASLKITRRVAASKVGMIADDPRESPMQSLTWYGTQITHARGCICHLTDPARDGAAIYNARSALVAGMAHAMQKPLLMLVEGDYLSPIDYRELSFHYNSSTQALKHAEPWLTGLEKEHFEHETKKTDYIRTLARQDQLKALQIGEYIAEFESQRLVDDYFIETAAYNEALSGQHSVFVGRKGSGKTATFLKLSAELAADKRNVVTMIKPVAYDVQGVVRLLSQVHERNVKGFAMASLWKYLIYTEVGNTLAREIESHPTEATTEDHAFLSLMNRPDLRLREPFSERLERKVDQYHLSESLKTSISEDLHRGILRELRSGLVSVLQHRRRIAILVDNLDLAWDKRDDVRALSEVILGLLDASRSTSDDLYRDGNRGRSLIVSLAIFLRADIYATVVEHTPEPDKIKSYKMQWSDRELLGRVIDERLVYSQGGQIKADEIWKQFFVANVRGIPTRDYFRNIVLPRPRDLVFFVKTAIATAVNRGHQLVGEDDVLEAEKRYSQFAVEVLSVENATAIRRFDDIILSFVGRRSEVGAAEIISCLQGAGIADQEAPSIIESLSALGFLGLEIRSGQFEFVDDPSDRRRLQAMARGVVADSGAEQKFSIHPAFWSFLDSKHDDEGGQMRFPWDGIR